ncbi:putative Restriction endonuclease, type II-like [Vibrio nigripulchritudo MADA3029]|uniref:YraN family protein n=1 Tax=Vibrio nigripulchritudo TaxID=28173 RepID=UPI0003B22F2E|nr:YraN family protein [Vibrio nigripulchritudo]CCN47196.1 putative Restriction endonuclease, type II-like [Vibrio nigripulchritudo MADA3020]CCN55452.1 putative Restriction endonuclease, type II-like [Vibrio nigripulchritudo MADA3021]CCN60406.1 putative Restriction endonuclease, type II-like [Vibrio nigripulchritudo MADA3029]
MKLFNRRALGEKYEALASKHLIGKGLSLIESNFNTKVGELDLIMSEQNTLVFVEVKYRKQSQFGHAAEIVTPAKQKKIVKTAMLWLRKNNLSPYNTDFRFDVVAIHDNGRDIEWIKNAITQG